RRHHPRRPIVVTSPAKAAALRTAARNFNQESIAHLCLRGEDGCRWCEHFITTQLVDEIELLLSNRATQAAFLRVLRRDRTADARWNALFCRRVGVDRAIFVVADKVKGRNVEAPTLTRERQQQFFFRFVLKDRIDKFRSQNLAFTYSNHVREFGDGLGI